MSALKYGNALTTISRQNIIPILRGLTGEVLGFYPIASTNFTGAEVSVTLSDGTPAITTVTMPTRVSDGSNFGPSQYMASVLDEATYRDSQWQSYQSFVPAGTDTGYQRWSNPATGAINSVTLGVLATSLLVTMNSGTTTPVVPAPVTANPTLAMNWSAGLQVGSAALECPFFDFNWVNLFQAKSGSKAISIEIVTNPAGGVFKSTLVPIPVAGATGGVIYNTIRVIKLKEAAPGAYVFTYKVTDDAGTTTNCTLTLTVAA